MSSIDITEDRLRAIIREELDRPTPMQPVKRDLRTREQHERSIGRLLVTQVDPGAYLDLHDPKTE